MPWWRPIAVAWAVCAAALLAPAGAAAAVTIGSDLDGNPGGAGAIAPGAMAANGALPPGSLAAGGLTAPSAGVVVSWTLRSGPSAMPSGARLRILSGNTAAATGAIETVPASGGANTFPARIAIEPGERLGFETTSGSNVSAVVVLAGATFHYWPVAPGESETLAPLNSPGFAILLNARVEPDADRDVFGDESQDACPGVPGPRGGCPEAAVRPDTSITGAPAKKVKGRRATIAFASTDPTASFECALDGGGFKPCGSPLKLKRLRRGGHRVQVRAISGAGLVDESPAVARFKVGKRRR